MAGKKMIHRNICVSDKLNAVSEGAETLYVRMLSNVDDYGHISANPHTLKDLCYPKRPNITADDIEQRLQELLLVGQKINKKIGLIRFYTVHGVRYLEIDRFEDFQQFRSDRGRRQDYPKPKGYDPIISNNSILEGGIPHDNRLTTTCPSTDIPKVEVEGEVEVEYTHSESGPVVCVEEVVSFEEIWEAYPNKDGRKAAERHFQASVKTSKDSEDIKRALKNYLASDKVQRGFVKNGSTWFNNWRDWVNYKPPSHGMRMLAAAQNLQDTLERTYANAK